MFVDPKVDAQVKANIRLIAASVWDACAEDARHEVGLRYATFSANGDVERKAAAKEFLDRTTGLGYLPTDALALELNEQLDNLEAAHQGFSNYANEVPHAKSLAKYIPDNGVVPTPVLAKYVKVLLLCRIGNANYGDGVSTGSKPYYDRLIQAWQEREILQVVRLLADSDISSRLQFTVCQENFRGLVGGLRSKVTNVHLTRALDMISESTPGQLPGLASDSRYKKAVQAVSL